MNQDNATDDLENEFAGEIDREEFSKPASRGDLYSLMLIVRLNQVIVETSLLALDGKDDETFRRKLEELDRAGTQASSFIKRYGNRLRKKLPSEAGQ